MKGLLNIHKPVGMTSNDIVRQARKQLGERHIGHMGTLDPLASGVLLLGVGKAARLFDFFLKKQKSYVAEFQFGYQTDTLDSEGVVVAADGPIPVLSDIQAILSKFVGKIMQLPPIYSAKNVDGVRAYKLARAGKAVELKPSEVEIFRLAVFAGSSPGSFRFEIICSGGTYIRSLCRDIARELKTFATMTALVRASCGDFSLSDSASLQQLSEGGAQYLIPLDQALSGLPRVDLPSEFYTMLQNGVRIKNTFIKEELFSIYCKEELFGIGHEDTDGSLRIKCYLKD